jgi:perosamine synthetase
MSDADIPLSIPHMLGNEARYLAECVETNWVSTRGPFVDRFESEVAKASGVRHAVATMNGTAALHVALLVAGVKPDEEVLVSDLTFIASANAVRYAGAWPVLIDAERDYWQMDPQKLHDFLARECRVENGALVNRSTRRRVRALMPVHILGHPCDLDPILAAARRYDLVVVADAAEAMGATYRGRPVAAQADISALSFNGNKIVTAGGGGAVVTDREDFAVRARYLTTQAKDDELEFVHHEIGFNYRLTNLQAAVGLAQLEELGTCVASKQETAHFYDDELAALPFERPRQAPWAAATWWLYTVLTDRARPEIDSRAIGRHLAAARIETRPLWRPVSMQRPYAGCQAYHCEVSRDLHQRSLSLPCSVGIPRSALQRVVDRLNDACRQTASGRSSAAASKER